MSSHTVYRLTSRNGFDGIEAFQEPIPVISKHEVLIKVRGIGLNYRDIATALGTLPLTIKDRVVPCSDMAGEIAQVGAGVEVFSVGDHVTCPVSPVVLYGPVKDEDHTLGGTIDGVMREYIALPAHTIVKLPSSSHSFVEWGAVVTTASTVWNAFYGHAPLKPGQTVLVLGTGGVSLTALIFAKAAGATTIITSSSDEKLRHVKAKYGVTHTINYKSHPDWAAEIKRITNGRGVDHIIEVGGVGTMGQSLQCVSMGGVVSAIGFLSALPSDEMPDVTFLTIIKGAILRGILAGSKQQLEEAVQFIAAKDLPVPVDRIFEFDREGIIAAFKHVASGEHIGKVCISVD
ncbi:hypothetical protein PV11_07879 [Exophiala sideris]|uniref:Enoyl reductase (ER) domain-containing protein n=1 Tax=Exophiala sideris TaxID=1016849 RepID=A0A0D1Z083_9EURO|nr:hypothetical protein PV11_07879 [Exophiala sideris]